jgi:hypothetical protein
MFVTHDKEPDDGPLIVCSILLINFNFNIINTFYIDEKICQVIIYNSVNSSVFKYNLKIVVALNFAPVRVIFSVFFSSLFFP